MFEESLAHGRKGPNTLKKKEKTLRREKQCS
jgi:hypothetical protein